MKIIIRSALFIENCILPLIFLWVILNNLVFFVVYLKTFISIICNFPHDANSSIVGFKAITAYITNFFLFSFESLIFAGLVIKKKMHKSPDSLQEIIVPFVSTFFYLLFDYVKYSPFQMSFLFVPEQFIPICLGIGTVINAIGITVSAIATYNLRHSFSVLVEIRDIVSQGFYRYVRHPIYLGYNISTIGFLFMMPRVDFLVLSVLSTVLLIYRANLEEKKLMENSQIYYEYAKKTPAFIPRLSL